MLNLLFRRRSPLCNTVKRVLTIILALIEFCVLLTACTIQMASSHEALGVSQAVYASDISKVQTKESSENSYAVPNKETSEELKNASEINGTNLEAAANEALEAHDNASVNFDARAINDSTRNKNILSLTFDDGFLREPIERVLYVLKQKNIVTTFFITGSAIKKFPDLWLKALEDGHQICNHTLNHNHITEPTPESIMSEITGWEEEAVKVFGQKYLIKMKREFPYFRLPGGKGSRNEDIIKTVSDAGYIIVGWTVETDYSILRNLDPKETDNEAAAEKVCKHVVNSSANGSIILLHFIEQDTLRLESIIDGIIKKNISIRPLEEVLSNRGSSAK